MNSYYGRKNILCKYLKYFSCIFKNLYLCYKINSQSDSYKEHKWI